MSAPQGQLGPVAYLLCLSGSVLSRCIYRCSTHGLLQPLGETGAGGRREQAAGGSELGSVSFFNKSKSGLPQTNTVHLVAVHPLRDLESDSQYVVQRPRPTLIKSSVGLSFLMPSIASRMSCLKKKNHPDSYVSPEGPHEPSLGNNGRSSQSLVHGACA